MATMSLTDTDLRVREAVVRQLDWDPEVDSSAVGVAAKSGVVTLTGFIGSYSASWRQSGRPSACTGCVRWPTTSRCA
ncbi:MAG: hypothetical protein ACRD3C_25945 [Vicinamibacterales bacterium]